MTAPLTARIIDGKAIAATLRATIRDRTAALPFQPGLVVVLVGEDPASAVYVRNKDRAAQDAGLRAQTIRLPATTPQAELLDTIDRLNRDPNVDGILVQLPLPPRSTPAPSSRPSTPPRTSTASTPSTSAASAMASTPSPPAPLQA